MFDKEKFAADYYIALLTQRTDKDPAWLRGEAIEQADLFEKALEKELKKAAKDVVKRRRKVVTA